MAQKNMTLTKCPMPSLDPNYRNKVFEEVATGYTYEMAIEEARRCLNCKNKPCVGACPVRIDIPAFIEKLANEDIEGAFEVLRNTEHMLFDFTANTCDLAMVECIKAVGSERFMFGSDMPITKMRMYRISENGTYYNVVPRGLYGDVSNEPHMRETDEKDVTIMYYEQIRAMKRVAEKLNLSKEDIEDIFYNNAKRLIG